MTATLAPTLIRQDGRDKVTGSGRYAADLTVTGMLHGALRVADLPHARIRRIDTTAARALPGVHAVITAADVPEVRYGAFLKDRTLFARDVVRWEGDLIAAVAAATPEIAAQAAALIDIDFEPLPALTDLEAAMRPDAPLVHEAWATYETDENLARDGNVASRSTIVKGDAAAAMAGADIVVTGRYVADGSHAVPIEPRAILAEWQGDHVTIWSSTQVPFAVRSGVAETLGMPQNQVRVIVPHLGGGFGAKCELGFEPQVAALAQAAGRPVKVVFSRRQEFLLPDHRRERMIMELTTGRPDGRDDRGPPGAPDHRQRRLQHGRAVPRPDGRDVRGRAVPDPERRRRGRRRLHEHAAVGLRPRADGPDDLLGARAAPRRRRRAARPRPGRVPAAQPRARGRRGTDRPGLRADRRHRDAGARGGGDRLGPAARGRRGGRDRDRLVAVVPGPVGRAPDASTPTAAGRS